MPFEVPPPHLSLHPKSQELVSTVQIQSELILRFDFLFGGRDAVEASEHSCRPQFITIYTLTRY